MIYKGIKRIFTLALNLFFKEIRVTGQEHIPLKGPLILVANHPNTLLDPVLVGVITKQQVGFVAMASLFQNKILASILTYLHVLPVVRKQDLKPGEKADNLTTFRKAHDYLRARNTLVIFPEGASFYEMRLQELKTGTARIALSYEKEENYQGNLRIIPIALDYSDSIQFRSSISITINEGIEVGKYAAEYEQDNLSAIRSLTEEIRQNLAEYTPETEGKEQEHLLIQLHKFYTTYIDESANIKKDVRKSLKTRYQLAAEVKNIHAINSEKYDQLQSLISDFYKKLDNEKITPGYFTSHFQKSNKTKLLVSYVIEFILLFPLYIYGLLTNFIPYSLPLKIFKALKLKIEYKTSVELTAGVIIFPLFYALNIWLFRHFVTSNIWWTLLFAISLPFAGYFAMYYWSEVKHFSRLLRYNRMSDASKMEIIQLKNRIKELIAVYF